jgi:hypothetical protein
MVTKKHFFPFGSFSIRNGLEIRVLGVSMVRISSLVQHCSSQGGHLTKGDGFLEYLQPRTPKRPSKGIWGMPKKSSQSRAPKATSVRTCPKYCPASLAHPSIRDDGHNFYTCFLFGGHVWGTRLETGAPQTWIRSGHPPNDQSGAFVRRRLGDATGDALIPPR